MKTDLPLPCKATTRFGSDWPMRDGGSARLDAGAEVIVRYKAADQDGFDTGLVCQTNTGWLVIEEQGLRF